MVVVEKRKHARYPLVLAVSWPGHAGARDHTEDLSANGLFIRTERKLAAGDQVPLELSFPGLLERLGLTVKVVRLRDAGPDGPQGVGVTPSFLARSQLRLRWDSSTCWKE